MDETSAAPPRFRRAEFSDHEVVREVSLAAYAGAYEPRFGWIPKPAIEDYSTRISDGNVWILASVAEPAVGVLVVERSSDAWMVYSIAVRPAFQGRGYARLLLRHAESEAKSANISRLNLYTNTQMQENIRLYESEGYVKTGVRPHPSREGLFLQDMQKRV